MRGYAYEEYRVQKNLNDKLFTKAGDTTYHKRTLIWERYSCGRSALGVLKCSKHINVIPVGLMKFSMINYFLTYSVIYRYRMGTWTIVVLKVPVVNLFILLGF